MPPPRPLDFGSGYVGAFTSWQPDHDLNPQYGDIPDHDRIGMILRCGPHGEEGSVFFDRGPQYAGLFGDSPRWTVEQEDPLTLSPSIAAPCGCHGFIREGRWVPA